MDFPLLAVIFGLDGLFHRFIGGHFGHHHSHFLGTLHRLAHTLHSFRTVHHSFRRRHAFTLRKRHHHTLHRAVSHSSDACLGWMVQSGSGKRKAILDARAEIGKAHAN